jgi:prepilin-type N-terminal cleavage/methylation domain-containing protein
MEMKYARKQQGFTLVELIVAMSLFSIIVVVISGIFMQTVKFQKIVANRAAAIDNLGLAMEEIARGTRTGVKFTELDLVGRDSSVGVTELKFENYKTPPETVRYYSNEGRIYKEIDGKFDLPITSSNIEITDLKFILQGKNKASGGPGDPNNIPPRITILMTAKGIYKELFTLQTTVGARLIYYKAR